MNKISKKKECILDEEVQEYILNLAVGNVISMSNMLKDVCLGKSKQDRDWIVDEYQKALVMEEKIRKLFDNDELEEDENEFCNIYI